MKTLLRNLFLSHWERKSVSFILAIIIWLVVNHSLTIPRTLENVSVRIINIPSGLTVEGMQTYGVLSKKVTLTVTGNKNILSELSPADLEIVIDATDKTSDWITTIQKKNLVSLNPDIDLSKIVSRVSPVRLGIQLSRLVTEKIPVFITPPIGEAPPDYTFLDLWPYQLTLSVSGPENTIKQVKEKRVSLSFNLNDISKADLDAIQIGRQNDEVSFVVPDEWKQIFIPEISDRPFEIDDPLAKHLRLDFIHSDLHPIGKSIPINLFYPPEYSLTLNPETYRLSTGSHIQIFHGIPLIQKSLYAKGISRLFVEVVQDMLEISVIVAPKSERRFLEWCVQFVNPKALEDRYVSMLLSDARDEELIQLQPKKREEYLRNRFRGYMNRFQLFKTADQKFDLRAELKGTIVHIEENE